MRLTMDKMEAGNFQFVQICHHVLWHNYIVSSSILSWHKTVMYLPEAAVLLLAVAASQFDDFAYAILKPIRKHVN